MSDDDGIMCGAPAPQGEGAEPDDLPPGIAVGSGDEGPAPAGIPPPRRRNRLLPTSGTFGAFIVADATSETPACAAAEGRSPDACLAPRCVIGVARCMWRFVEADDDARSSHTALTPPPSERRVRAQPPWGYVQYVLSQSWSFEEPLAVDDTFDMDTVASELRIRQRAADVVVSPGGLAVKALLARQFGGETVHLLRLHPFVAVDAVRSGEATLVQSFPLALRSNIAGMLPANPPSSLVPRWRKQLDVKGRARASVNDGDGGTRWDTIALELPAGRAAAATVDVGDRTFGPAHRLHHEADPLTLLLGLQFGSFLKNQHEFSKALDAANKLETGWEAPARDRSHDGGRSTYQRASDKLDVVGLLLHRRELSRSLHE